VRHGSAHVGHTVMNHVVNDVGWFGIRGRPRCLGAPALVDGDVDDNGARLHRLHHRGSDQLRRSGARHQHRTDEKICLHYGLSDGVAGREHRAHGRAELERGGKNGSVAVTSIRYNEPSQMSRSSGKTEQLVDETEFACRSCGLEGAVPPTYHAHDVDLRSAS
jgi:hypothetical protein